jgi:biopolymer transport protein ExbB
MDNFIYIFRSGGIVSWPLLASSIAALALIIERLFFWFKVNRRQRRVVREVLKLYIQNPDDAIKKLQVNADLPLARIFLEALELDSPNIEEFRLVLESAAQAEIPVLKRFNTIFDTIITLSPLFGLLGTVLGLITTFGSLKLGDAGGTNAAGVTGGISEALVSTAMGLVVAIFTLLFANMFRGFYLQQIAFIQEAGGQLELLYRHRYEKLTRESNYAPTR